MKNLLIVAGLLALATVTFSQGTYIEMKLSSNGNASFSGTFKMYAQNGNSRTEMKMIIPQLPGGGMNLTMLKLSTDNANVFMLNEKEKTYTEFSAADDEEYKDYPQNEYDVTVLGKEKVNGYNATHVIVKVKGRNFEQEMWTSTEIANYNNLTAVKSKYWGKDNLNKALSAKGAAGFPVRILVEENRQKIQMDLVKAEARSNPASMFSLSGYTKTKGMELPGGVQMQELMDQLKNATPEEREEMMRQLQKLYTDPH